MQRRAPTSPVFDELRGIQRTHGYLPEEELRALAARLDIPHFFLEPARAEVRVCGDMVCHRHGGSDLREHLTARFQGQDVNVRHVSCLGRCDLAPAMVVNGQIFEKVTETGASALIDSAVAGASPEELAARRPASAEATAGRARSRVASDPYPDEASRYGVRRSFVQSKDWAGLIATLKASGLRGLGGAGFPTGMKWELVRNQPGPDKFIVCNADESEPGTIKDRHIMTNAGHLLIEGMILGGLVSGARHGIYIRSATVRARTAVVVLEMLRNVLDILQKNKTFRAELERNYRSRALETHLRSVPVLASMPQDFVQYLRDRVELKRYSPGEVIVRQGEAADAFYLVRLGFVKVSERHPGGDLVLAYLGRGGFLGEMGLLGRRRSHGDVHRARPRRRGEDCRATCHQEHRGRVQLAKTDDRFCVGCHGDRKVTPAPPKVAAVLGTFPSGHPEFAAVRPGATDPAKLRFNHAVHLKDSLRGLPAGASATAGSKGPEKLECANCHRPEALRPFGTPEGYPAYLPTNVTRRWMPRTVFDHTPHRMVTCASCHQAEASTKTPDVLLPDQAVCATCHAPARKTEYRCFECHQYHDWTKSHPISPLIR